MRRLAWAARAALLHASLAAAAAGQSNARPLPLLARAPASSWALAEAAAPASFRAASVPEFDTQQAVRPGVPRLADEDGGGYAELEFFGGYQGSTEFQNDAGTVGLQRGGWTGTVGSVSDQGLLLAVRLRTEATFYDFVDAGALFGGHPDPLNDVYETSVGFSALCSEVGASWPGWFLGAEVALAGEDGAELSDALVVGGLAGLRIQPHDDLSLSLGAAARSRLGDDPFVIPYVGFDWRMTDAVRFAVEGSEIELATRLSDELELSLRSSFEMRQYRLNPDGPLLGGVLQDDHVQATAGLTWKPWDGAEFRFDAGAVIWREFNVLDAAGDSTRSLESEPGPFAVLSATFSF